MFVATTIAQKATLDAYDISLDVYEGSGLGHCGEVHRSIYQTCAASS